MFPLPCRCWRPLIYRTEPGHCTKCGHDREPPAVGELTRQLAAAIAEVALGHRKVGDARHGNHYRKALR